MGTELRKRFFAWMLKKGDASNYQTYAQFKKELLKDLHGTVVEIGPGTGVNFVFFQRDINWIGIEPNELFHDTLLNKASEYGIAARVLKGDASSIPIPDNTADYFICTLVLCSVKDPSEVIREIKRVLKAGGQLIFIEHVAAERGTGLRIGQNLFNPINRMMADGCNCNRETWTFIENGGFSELVLKHQKIKGALGIFSPHIMGHAVK